MSNDSNQGRGAVVTRATSGIGEAADRAQDELGGAEVLIDNAGVMLLGPFATGQRQDYRQMIGVNLLASITAIEVFLDQLKNGCGRPGDVRPG